MLKRALTVKAINPGILKRIALLCSLLAPIALASPSTAAELPRTIAVDFKHACAVTTEQRVRCWGNNLRGELGKGSFNNYIPIPTKVLAPKNGAYLNDVKTIDANNRGTCVTTSYGAVLCWGRHDCYYKYGNNNLVCLEYPWPRFKLNADGSKLIGALNVSLGHSHICAVVAGGMVKCWGHNERGQLGDGTRETGLHPVTVKVPDRSGLLIPLTGAKSVSAGANHTCAVMWSGSVKCWGDNHYGQLARVEPGFSSYAVSVFEKLPLLRAELFGATQISAGDEHTCARISDGTVRCWGKKWPLGQKVEPPTDENTAAYKLKGLNGVGYQQKVKKVTSGLHNSCAVLEDQTARCWGDGSSWNNGNASTKRTPYPVRVKTDLGSTMTGIVSLETGSQTCAVKKTGKVYCWGLLPGPKGGVPAAKPVSIPW